MDGTWTRAVSQPLTAPSSAPHAQVTTTTTGIGSCSFASVPAATPHTANADPMEISISPVTIKNVMPSAMISTGRFARKRSLKFPAVKKSGAIKPSPAARISVAAATAASLP